MKIGLTEVTLLASFSLHETMYNTLPIISNETVRWSLPEDLMAPSTVPTSTQQTATTAIRAMNHRKDPGFHANNPQQLLGGSSEYLVLQKKRKSFNFEHRFSKIDFVFVLVKGNIIA